MVDILVGLGYNYIIDSSPPIILEIIMANLDQFVLNLSKQMIEFVRLEYNAPDFDVRIRCDYSPRRKCSWGGIRGGKNFISLALSKYQTAAQYNDPVTFNEYKHFAADPVIGTVTADWQKALAALIAHEMAHAVELGSIKQNAVSAHGLNQVGKHGNLWKEIYRKFRLEFVNDSTFETAPVIHNTATITKIKTPRKQKARQWNSEYVRSNRGSLIHYYVKQVQVGTIFRSDFGPLFLKQNNDWLKLETQSLCDARKLCFNI